LVDGAHLRGLAVILDVVYNHVGPEGNYFKNYSPFYFHETKSNEWGDCFNFDGPESGPVRNFFRQNLAYWLDEYRVDGVRLDATHAIHDTSERHILQELAALAHAKGAFVIAEDERNAVELLQRPDGTGLQLDAVWSDDFHHEVRVALTGTRESYFSSYRGNADALKKTLSRGWSYCGEDYPFWGGRPRGEDCTHLAPSAFVFCIENHDQVGNRAFGERLEHLVEPAAFRAASALLCLSPYTPLIFMGQEWRSSSPFLFFSNHGGELGRQTGEGRKLEFERKGLNTEGRDLSEMPDPEADSTFERSKLYWGEIDNLEHAQVLNLYQQCLRLRRTRLGDSCRSRKNWTVQAVKGVVCVRYWPAQGASLLLLVDLEGGAVLSTESDLSAPPADGSWKVLLHSNEVCFGGGESLIRPGALIGPHASIYFSEPGAILLEATSVTREETA
jgi:maltooligosyltrehalose trehalohydrolase